MKLIDADEFVEWLMSDAITDEQRKFAEQVKYAADRMKPAQPVCEDAVPWEQLERYAEWFCAQVSYPEFIREAKAFCESTIAGMKGGNIAPSVTPKQPGWIPVTERLPKNEQEVFVTVEVRPFGRKPFRRVVRAFYTDGKHTDADSAYTWYELEEPDFDDDGNIIVPEGWWESSDYSEQQEMIDDFIMAWREPLKPWEGGQDG